MLTTVSFHFLNNERFTQQTARIPQHRLLARKQHGLFS